MFREHKALVPFLFYVQLIHSFTYWVKFRFCSVNFLHVCLEPLPFVRVTFYTYNSLKTSFLIPKKFLLLIPCTQFLLLSGYIILIYQLQSWKYYLGCYNVVTGMTPGYARGGELPTWGHQPEAPTKEKSYRKDSKLEFYWRKLGNLLKESKGGWFNEKIDSVGFSSFEECELLKEQ